MVATIVYVNILNGKRKEFNSLNESNAYQTLHGGTVKVVYKNYKQKSSKVPEFYIITKLMGRDNEY